MTALEPLTGLVVIAEVQLAPDLFPLLRVLADRHPLPARFLVLGSASGDLLRQSSESLAGRVEHLRMSGFTLDEVERESLEDLWRRGGFPDSLLAPTEEASVLWRRGFIDTLVGRDLLQWGVRVSPTAMRRFWTMVAHYHGQVWNNADPARTLGVGETTVRRCLDLLTDALVIRELQPWHANLRKRQVKSPKVYVRDSGLLHELLGIEDHRVDAPRVTPSIRNALVDLGLERVAVVYPGTKRYPLADRVEAVPVATLAEPGRLFESFSG